MASSNEPDHTKEEAVAAETKEAVAAETKEESVAAETKEESVAAETAAVEKGKEAEVSPKVEEEAAEDEDTGAQIAPIVQLVEVAVTTGEEDEDALLDLKAKLYRFDKDGNQWKERGAGTVKLLKHKVTGKVRLVMRQSKTLKICANHLVFATMTVQVHAGNEKSCVWHAPDFSDGELKDEMFCIRFASVENCKTFMEKVEEIAESLKTAEETVEASEAAALLGNLSVEEAAPAAPAPVADEGNRD